MRTFINILISRLMYGVMLWADGQGVFGKYKDGSQILPSGRYVIAMDDKIHELNLQKTPLLMLMSKLGKKSVRQMKYEWMTEERMADYVASTAVGGAWASAAANSGTITVGTSDAYMFAEGDVLLLPAISQTVNIYVDSVVLATGVLTCYTVDSTIDLSSVGSSYPQILRLGNSFESGTGKGTIKNKIPVEAYNYIQIHQTPVGITTTDQHVEYRGGDQLARDRRIKGVEHAFGIEKSLFFGQRYRRLQGRMDSIYQQCWTGGIRSFLSTNVTNASGALTQTEFSDWLVDSTRYAEMPIVFAGELVFEGLHQWAESKLQITSVKEDMLGMYVYKYTTPYGNTVRIIPHRDLLTEATTGMAFCVDMNDVGYRFLEGLDTHLEVGIQDPDLKQTIDEYRTWFGLWLGNEKRHGLLHGVTSIST